MRVLPIHPPRALPLPVQAAVVILACILLFWVGIASSGFNQSEGFRVFPAYEMLDSGDWVVPRLFGQAYLRKPPGVPWAIAFFSELLGRTEFAARATGAFAMTLSCLTTLVASSRWFGPRFSLLAALAHALTPLFWYSARSAEIEAINNLFTQLCVVAILDTILVPRPSRPFRALACLWIALGTAGLLLSKGPASLPCVGGAFLAAAFVQRRVAPAFNPYALSATALGCVPFLVWLYLATMRSKGLDPVTQTPGRFLWDPEHLIETLLLAPRAWASALPWSAFLIVPLLPPPPTGRGLGGRSAFRPVTPGGVWREFDRPTAEPDDLAKALTLTTLLALLIYTITGINNVRYTMPALTFFFPLIAWFWTRNLGLNAAAVAIAPPRAARAWRVAPVIVLAIAACVWLPMEEARRDRNSGREVGRRLAEALPDNAHLGGDLIFDTRPEVFYYASRHAAERGKRLTFRWIPDRGRDVRPSPVAPFWAVRTDDRDEFNKEFQTMSARGWLAGWDPVFHGEIQRGRFTFTVYKKR
jgi:4-amino-4-deoxy-L-arabinose transferase-like glycosyltransferase